MGQWLIADLSVSDVHLQLWMLLVAGVILFWFLYVGRPANACGAGSKFLSVKNGSAGGDPISGAGERYFRCAA